MTQTLENGDTAPDFTLPGDNGGTVALNDFKGKTVVLYFYPKDDTSGCTQQACDFRDNIKAFEKIGVPVIGVSKDSVKAHDKFKEKYGLNFPLASDENGDVCERYGVWTEKSMYGRKYMGIERTTFLIGPDGKIAQVWRKVKIPGHIAEVQQAAETLDRKAA